MPALGIYAWFGYVLPLEERLALIRDAGFDTTCLWIGPGEKMVHDGLVERMPGLARERGLTVDNVHAPYEHVNHLWSGSRRENAVIRREYAEALAYCHRHGIPRAVMHVVAGAHPPPPTREGIQIIRDLVRQAEDLGVTMALENTERTEHLSLVFDEIQSPRLGFCYDSSHDFIAGQSRGGILKKWGALLAALHLSDNHGATDDHLVPGEGSIDWPALGASFPRSYPGALMLEVISPDPALPPEEFLQTACGRLCGIRDGWLGAEG